MINAELEIQKRVSFIFELKIIKKIILISFAALLAFALVSVNSRQTSANASVKKRKVLYLTHSAGFKHAVLPESEKVFKELGEKSGAFEVVATQDCSLLNKEALKQFDVVVFYTTGELPISDEQKQDFMAFIKSGKGFIGIHSATDTFYKWAEYGDMIGGYFDQHPWHQEVTVKVEDA